MLDRAAHDGRLRLDVHEMPDAGRIVADTLRAIPGVVDVEIDPRMGGVTILYEPNPTVPRSARQEPPPAPAAARPALPARRCPARSMVTGLVQTVVVVALEVALQRVLGPLFGSRRS